MRLDRLGIPINDDDFAEITIDAVQVLNVVAINITGCVTEQTVHDVAVRVKCIQQRISRLQSEPTS